MQRKENREIRLSIGYRVTLDLFPCHYGPEQLNIPALIIRFSLSSGVNAAERVSKTSSVQQVNSAS